MSVNGSLSQRLIRAAALYEAALNKRLNEISRLTARQVLALSALRIGPLTIDALADQVCLPLDQFAPILDPLIEKSLVAREGDIYTLTGQGGVLLGHLWAVVEEAEVEVLSGFTAAERAALADYLQRIQAVSQLVIDEVNPWEDEEEEGEMDWG